MLLHLPHKSYVIFLSIERIAHAKCAGLNLCYLRLFFLLLLFLFGLFTVDKSVQ